MTKRTLARPAKADRMPLKLKGKTVAFAGKFGKFPYQSRVQSGYQSGEEAFGRLIETEGGMVVADVTANLDYLVVGQTRGRTEAEKQVERLNQKYGATIQILDENAFRQLFALTRDEAIALLRGGEQSVARWDRLRDLELYRQKRMPPIDLSGIDLRGVNFHRANLREVVLDGADLRDADLTQVCFDELRNVKLDGACLQSARVWCAHDCTFRTADLSDAHIKPADYQGSNFTAAKLTEVLGGYTQAAGVVFRKADLSHAWLEESNFQRADFTGADLHEARLVKCDFTDARLTGAKLNKADLTDAKFLNADLSKADLRECILAGADFTGANIDGADFTGVNLTGARIAGLNTAKTRGFDLTSASVGGKIGPNIRELEKVAKQSRRLETFAVIDMKDHPAEMRLICYHNAQWISAYGGTPGMGYNPHATSFGAGMIDLARRWTNGTLRLASITAKSSKGPLGGKPLQRLAIAAWCEACGVAAPSEAEIAERLQASKTSQNDLREQMLQELCGGAAGIKRWNARSVDERKKAGHFRRVDLSHQNLSGADLQYLDFQGAIFDNATLDRASLWRCDLRQASFRNARLKNVECGSAKFSGADFTAASLYQAHLRVCTFCSAVFNGADLRGADFGYADLRGADLSGADLSKAKFEHTKYNEETRMPPGFKHLDGMEWKAGGPAPGTVSVSPATPSAGAIDFGTLMERLPQTVHSSSLSKALQMLKADRFQLYAEVKDDALVGVVKSQSDPNLVYSCRLSADGAFACCTQNLRPCGGLHGKLCKHLLVLLVGLAKAGQLEPAAAERWAQTSRHRRPALNKDVMSETFLRYKGAEAGEVDWRPTETIPEDYYAL